MSDKFDVAGITSFVTMDRYGNIKIPYAVICEMFGSMTKATGSEWCVFWNRETNSITLKKIGKATNDDI